MTALQYMGEETLEDGSPVYHVLTPFETARGTLIVDRGLVPGDLRDPSTRLRGQLSGERHIVGVWRVPDPPARTIPFIVEPPDITADDTNKPVFVHNS